MASIEINIRPAIANDLPALMALDHSVLSDSVWQLDFRREAGQVSAVFHEARLPRPTTVQFPRKMETLREEWTCQAHMQTALLEELPIGYICGTARSLDGTLRLTHLTIAAAYRRRKFGTQLLESAQNWAAQNSIHRLILEVPSKNMPMIRLAQKFGYEFCGYNDLDYSNRDIALYFGRQLK